MSYEPTPLFRAALDLISRMGAKAFEVGYLNDDAVTAADADWWASAQWHGTKVHVEHHTSPDAAADALARRLLHGGQCAHCGRTVAIRGSGRGVCDWTVVGDRWVRGCVDRVPEGDRLILSTKRGDIPKRTRRRR